MFLYFFFWKNVEMPMTIKPINTEFGKLRVKRSVMLKDKIIAHSDFEIGIFSLGLYEFNICNVEIIF